MEHEKMNVVVLARERSRRYKRKHLHPIRTVPMLYGMLNNIRKAGGTPILCTGPREENKAYVILAGRSNTQVYCEENRPEWDIVSRMVGMAEHLGIERWIFQSGDCPFPSFPLMRDLWAELETGKWDKVNIGRNTYTRWGERMTCGETLSFWKKVNEYYAPEDPRREQQQIPKELVKVTCLHGPEVVVSTPLKLSVDYPLEGAIVDLIVRHLGRWPQSDEDILRAYNEITVLNPDTDNTPPAFNDPTISETAVVDSEEKT